MVLQYCAVHLVRDVEACVKFGETSTVHKMYVGQPHEKEGRLE
jgi:hypothetical protein